MNINDIILFRREDRLNILQWLKRLIEAMEIIIFKQISAKQLDICLQIYLNMKTNEYHWASYNACGIWLHGKDAI